MPLPEIQKMKAEKTLSSFCNSRVPPHARDQVELKYEIRGNFDSLKEEVDNDPTGIFWG